MGSSLSHAAWATIAVLSGILFLVFDAVRFFVQQVSASMPRSNAEIP